MPVIGFFHPHRLTLIARVYSADAEQTSLFSDDQHFSAAGQALVAAYDFTS
jgi:hypothetical protein